MKKRSLSTAHALLMMLCICLLITAFSIKTDLKEKGKTYSENNRMIHESEEEGNDFFTWEALSFHLLTFNK